MPKKKGLTQKAAQAVEEKVKEEVKRIEGEMAEKEPDIPECGYTQEILDAVKAYCSFDKQFKARLDKLGSIEAVVESIMDENMNRLPSNHNKYGHPLLKQFSPKEVVEKFGKLVFVEYRFDRPSPFPATLNHGAVGYTIAIYFGPNIVPESFAVGPVSNFITKKEKKRKLLEALKRDPRSWNK